jgi:protein involved in plasmid replication-relaxation
VGEPDASLWFHLTERDRLVLALLGEHKVLTTTQIAEAVAFASLRRAQDRLRRLRALGVVFTFRDSYLHGGTSQGRHALGYAGVRLIAAQRAVAPPRPAAYQQTLERLAAWPKLEHQLGVNELFCRLAGFARRHPDAVRGPDGIGGLTQWWSERRCSEFFWATSQHDTRPHPDGYGCWEEAGRAVRFFLEHDTGTEPLTRVTGKLAGYGAFPTDRFGVLLFSVHSAQREVALRAALRRATGGYAPGLVLATAARDHGHPDGPVGPVWAAWTSHTADAVTRRYRLLPERGPRVAYHGGFVGQPFSQAAFDAHDAAMTGLINQEPSAGTVAPAERDTDTWEEMDDDLTTYDTTDDDDPDDPYGPPYRHRIA